MPEMNYRPTAIIRIGGEVIKFKDSFENGQFSAALSAEEGRLTLEISPKLPLTFEELSVVGYAEMLPEDRVFLNGYQSWTDSTEHTAGDSMKGITRIPSLLVKKYDFDKYGDYNFTHYSSRRGTMHGWTYAYVRRGGEFFLCGSLSERQGFTRITLLADRRRIKVARECEGAVYSEPFRAVDCIWIRGSEDEVFDRWYEASDMKRERPAAGLMQGYTSWYRYYQDISEEKLLHDLDALAASSLPADIFQIDDGYQTAVGDWLSTDKTKFPEGLGPIVSAIHGKGLRAGLWLAPFVCERDSAVFEQHPGWIVKDKNGEPLSAGSNWSGAYALDIYNGEVREYLREVFGTVLGDWGFDMVKLDFLYAACIQPSGGKSRGQVMCEGMDFLRELCGDKLILGCGVPLGAAFGKVDYCRIGCDVGLSWNDNIVMQQTHRERVSTKNSLLSTVFRRQLDGRFFMNDPDVFLLREEDISMTPRQRQALAVINHLFGSVLFTSDDVSRYGEPQEKLLAQARSFIGAKAVSVETEGSVLRITAEADGSRRTLIFDTASGKLSRQG